MEVQISYFSEVGQDGSDLTLEQRIQEIVTATEGKAISLKTTDGIITCSNEEELRNALKEKGIL